MIEIQKEKGYGNCAFGHGKLVFRAIANPCELSRDCNNPKRATELYHEWLEKKGAHGIYVCTEKNCAYAMGAYEYHSHKVREEVKDGEQQGSIGEQVSDA